MRILILAFLFCLHSVVNAQDSIRIDKPIVCFPTLTLLATLKDKYHEQPIIVGKHGLYEDIVTAVYANTTAGTYTVIEMDKTIACIISIGTDLQFRFPAKNGQGL